MAEVISSSSFPSDKRHLLFQGCLCLAAFCKLHGIRHPSISAFITHRVGFLCCRDFSAWEAELISQPITGMGDPVPDDVLAVIPSTFRTAFSDLTNHTTEIAMADFWGGDTAAPSRFLFRCIDTLAAHQIPSPVQRPGTLVLPWGDPLTDPAFDEIIKSHAALLDDFIA